MQWLRTVSARRTNVWIRKQDSEILLQSAVDGVPQRKRQHPRNEFCWHTPRERAHSECSGYGLARRARTGGCLGLRRGGGCSIKQDSGQQKRAAGAVTKPQRSLLGREFLLRRGRGGNILVPPLISRNPHLPRSPYMPV